MIKKGLITILFFFTMALMLWFMRNDILTHPSPIAELDPLPLNKWQALSSNNETLARGQLQFKLRCYKCHGYNGEGNLKGPSLIDKIWIYPNDYHSLYEIIYYGIPNNDAMKGWGKKLLLSDIQALTVFVHSLKQ